MTTATRGQKFLTKTVNAEALRRVLMENYIWGFAQVKDLFKTVERKEKEMEADGEI